MVECIALGPTLQDSTFKSTPHFKQFLRTDANAGPNNLRQIELRRLARQMKFPSLAGRKDFDSFQADCQTDPSFKKYNDEGDHRVCAPNRDNVTLIDPVSGFVSVGGDFDRNTGRNRIKSMVQLNPHPPASVMPQRQTVVRSNASAPPELQRSYTFTTGVAPTAWDSKKLSDVQIRANLGGWTSEKDPSKECTDDSVNKDESSESEQKRMRDELASNYVWRTSTQRSYAEVPWDKACPPKMYPPTTTLEPQPDQISQQFSIKRYDSAPKDWQVVGRAWDWFQTRKNYCLYRPVDFCAHLPRAQQIPGYSGCIGAENVVDDRDNKAVSFEPYTVKRNPQPWRADTAARPNIPHYTGCTLYRSQSAAPVLSTSITHREVPVTPVVHDFKRGSNMSKMIRTVHPHNPFNMVNRPETTC